MNLMKIEEPCSNDWVRMLVSAMNEISEGECGIGCTINSERDYVATLRCKLCRSSNLRVLMSTEIPKEFILVTKQLEDAGYKGRSIYPDLVLHENHNREDLSPDHQHLVCEVKTAKNVAKDFFNKDLAKLNFYIQELNFRAAVYILVNSSKKIVEKRLKTYSEQNCSVSDKVKNGTNKIYFLIQPKLGNNVEIYSIDFN